MADSQRPAPVGATLRGRNTPCLVPRSLCGSAVLMGWLFWFRSVQGSEMMVVPVTFVLGYPVPMGNTSARGHTVPASSGLRPLFLRPLRGQAHSGTSVTALHAARGVTPQWVILLTSGRARGRGVQTPYPERGLPPARVVSVSRVWLPACPAPTREWAGLRHTWQ